jgi:hypothetical protein
MKTKSHRNLKNKTIKRRNFKPKIKTLTKDFPIYAAKNFDGETILKYTKKQEEKSKDKCLYSNISWFGDLKQAKIYKTSESKIYKWLIKKTTKLLVMNKTNEKFFEHYFKSFKGNLVTTINLTKIQLSEAREKLKDTDIDVSYLNMSQNEKAYFEFAFAYGYITVDKQYEFMRLITFLIQNKIIDIKKRDGTSIIDKINMKINYYFLVNKLSRHKKYNRLSLYSFDKDALINLCTLIPNTYHIDGVFQPNSKSFWFPDLKIYKMDISEYVLYNPHHNLIYDSIQED